MKINGFVSKKGNKLISQNRINVYQLDFGLTDFFCNFLDVTIDITTKIVYFIDVMINITTGGKQNENCGCMC